MTRSTRTYSDFSAGELTPLVYGRSDLAVFYNGTRRSENFLSQAQGGARFRTGTIYSSGTKGNNEAFLYKFDISNSISFVLEFTDSFLRFHRLGGLVESGGSPVEVATPWGADDIFNLKFAQDNDTLYIVHPDYQPRKLVYSSATSWALSAHSPSGLNTTTDFPSAVAFYEDRLVYGGFRNSGATLGPQSLAFSKAADPDNFVVGTNDDDGIRYTVSGQGNGVRWLAGTDRFLAIGVYGDVLQATGGIDDVITPTSISIRPANGYGCADINPISRGSAIYYLQREQLTLRSFQYNFEQDGYRPVNRNQVADHITLSGVTQLAFQEGRTNFIWAVRTDGEMVGMTLEETEGVSGWQRWSTDGDVISVSTSARDKAYDRLWVCVKRGSNYFIEYQSDETIYPRREDYYVDQNNKAVEDEQFDNLLFEAQKQYIHVDSSLTYDGLAEGVAAGATVTPASISGSSVTFTASASVFSSGDVGRQIWRKSVTGAETGRAEITAYTSATEVTCEIIEDFDSTDAIPAGEWYFTTDAVSGASHLDGVEVTVVADGGQHPKRTVASGAITLDGQASVVHIGYDYRGYLETNTLETGGTNGPAQTKKLSVTAAGIRFLDSLYVKYGTDFYNLEQLEFRSSRMKMDRPPTLFTGDRKVPFTKKDLDEFESGWKRNNRVVIVQDQPFPCNIQLVVPYATTSNV